MAKTTDAAVDQYEADEKARTTRERIADNCHAVGRRLLQRNGKPDYFERVDAHFLYAGSYRVNVWQRVPSEFGGSVLKMHSSFFVEIDEADLARPGYPLFVRSC
jgi:hypothetical protein